MNRNVVMK